VSRKDGWISISVSGNPHDRGFEYGFHCAEEFIKIKRMLDYNVYEDTGNPWQYYVDVAHNDFEPKIMEQFPEFYEEMQGVAEGCVANGCPTTTTEILAWNIYFTLLDSWSPPPDEGGGGGGSERASHSKEGGGGGGEGIGRNRTGASDRCSAFMAVGDYTEDGQIVVAHNSFSNFIDGQYMRILLDLTPEPPGHRMVMQTCACWIWSGTDFFVTSQGIIGTETTIGGFFPYVNKIPITFRIRNAMQYGKDLDDYVTKLLDGNSGDYANSWLFGDINTGEIMRIELGLEYHNVEKTTNGYFIGFNAAYDPRIRHKECNDDGFYDIRRHQGARRVRLGDLMETHKGKLNTTLAKTIIADHYDVYLRKLNKCSRTVCGHYELDSRKFMSDPGRPKPFQPRGALDGCVCDSKMAKEMTFYGRYGSSCGTPFNAAAFCKTHPQWANQLPYLEDRPSYPWTVLG